MITILRLALILTICSAATPAFTQEAATDTIRIETVLRSDWGAYVHFPPTAERLPAIITLGGAEGGLSFSRQEADAIAQEGFVVMRLGYFKYSKATMKQTLQAIRLEKIVEGIEWLKRQPGVDSTRIGLLGISKGAEAALLVAAKTPSVRAVAAHLPSHVAWYGLGRWKGVNKSSWTWEGAPVDFQPYGKPKSGWFTAKIREFYEAGLEKHPGRVERASIPVEKIAGPILLTSGGDDLIWPSAYMAHALEQRLKSKAFPFEVTHLHFPEAGHGIFGAWPDVADEKAMQALAAGGGTPLANFHARQQTWSETMAFFKRSLHSQTNHSNMQYDGKR